MFPTPFTVTHSVRVTGAADALGQPTITYTSTTRPVIGWSTKVVTDGGGDPSMAGRTITEVSLLTDAGDWSDGDKVTLPDGREFIIKGDPSDSNTGPFAFTPGYRVTMRRVHDA